MKYISYIYKITTVEDKTKIYISSTREKVNSLLLFFIKESSNIQSKKDDLYEWIKPLDKKILKIKTIKSYPVENNYEQIKREKYWIKKYKTYGYDVIHKSYNVDKKKCKLYVCFEDVSMSEIINRYEDKVVCISKNNFTFTNELNKDNNSKHLNNVPKPPDIPIIKDKTSNKRHNIRNIKKIEKPLPVNEGDGYLNELKNLLTLRKSSKLSVAELAKQNKPKKKIPNKIKIVKKKFIPPKPVINPGQELLKELKKTIRKIQ